MSFSTDIKKELSQINDLANKEKIKYELVGYLISENISKDGNNLKYSTESEYNINRFSKLLRNMNIEDFFIDIQGKIYSIKFKEKYTEDIIKENIKDLENIEYIKSLVRGAFLGSGSINNPENKYHLEISFGQKENRDLIKKMLENNNINVKILENSIYLKDSEEISKFLAFIGATKSLLKFEDIRVKREMNNKINRLVNCKTANLNKVLNASVEQIEAIKKLKENGDFVKLDDNLKELADLRLEHPEMSLEELGKLLKNPIGKSGVNYRLKKIIELAK